METFFRMMDINELRDLPALPEAVRSRPEALPKPP
jgi:hypothetical protein